MLVNKTTGKKLTPQEEQTQQQEVKDTWTLAPDVMSAEKSSFWVPNPVVNTNLKTGSVSYTGWWIAPAPEVQPIVEKPKPVVDLWNQTATNLWKPQEVPLSPTEISAKSENKANQVTQEKKTTPVTIADGQTFQLNQQEIKMREQNLKNVQRDSQQAEKTAKMTDLNAFLSWNPDRPSIERYLKINYKPEYESEYKTAIKWYFKNVDTNRKIQTYSVASKEAIYEAVKSGDLVPWTEAYNNLTPEKRQEYEQYAQQKQLSELTNRYTPSNPDFTDVLTSINKMFSTDYKKQYTEALANSGKTKLEEELNGINNEIATIDDSIDRLREDRAKANVWVPSSLQNAKNAVAERELTRQKNMLINQATQKQNSISSIKEDLKLELELARYDDESKKQAYQTALTQYNTERARMDAIEKANFEEQSKLRAEERQRDFQEKMDKIDKDFQKEMQKWTYQADRDWNLLYIKDWVAEKVLEADGTVVWVTKEKWFTDTIREHPDGTLSVLRSYDKWWKPDLFTYWVSWTNSQNTNLNVWNNISNVSDKVGKYSWETWKYECWEWVNYYLKDLWITNVSMWSTYESKKSNVNSQTPQVWGLAVWNPNPEWKFWENWHVGIVTGYNWEDGTVEITDWNAKWDREKMTYKVPVSQINNSDGWFIHLSLPSQTQQWQGFDEAKVPQYTDYIEDGKVPTWLKPWTSAYQNFINEAQQWYTFSKNQTLQTKGFVIDDVGSFSWTSKKQKEDIMTAINNVSPFIQSMDKAIEIVKTEWTALPFTEAGKKINQEIRNAQLLAKEIYNLWVLNWPDLALMESIIANPTNLSSIATSWQDYSKVLENWKKTILDNAIAKAWSVWLKFTLGGDTQPTQTPPTWWIPSWENQNMSSNNSSLMSKYKQRPKLDIDN